MGFFSNFLDTREHSVTRIFIFGTLAFFEWVVKILPDFEGLTKPENAGTIQKTELCLKKTQKTHYPSGTTVMHN
jgi:hypothetical protein